MKRLRYDVRLSSPLIYWILWIVWFVFMGVIIKKYRKITFFYKCQKNRSSSDNCQKILIKRKPICLHFGGYFEEKKMGSIISRFGQNNKNILALKLGNGWHFWRHPWYKHRKFDHPGWIVTSKYQNMSTLNNGVSFWQKIENSKCDISTVWRWFLKCSNDWKDLKRRYQQFTHENCLQLGCCMYLRNTADFYIPFFLKFLQVFFLNLFERPKPIESCM